MPISELEQRMKSLCADFGASEVMRALANAMDSPPEELKGERVHWDEAFGWLNVTESVISCWVLAYPGVNVKFELSRAHDWLIENPSRRKKNYKKFIESWFARAQKAARAHNNGWKRTSGGGFT